MIAKLYADAKVFEILAQSMEEEGIEVKLGGSLLIEDEVDSEKAIIMKPDLFYSSKNMQDATPKSADGVIFVADGDKFHLYIAELKSSRLQGLKKSDIQEKFDTIFNRFFVEDYAHVFDNDQLPYNLVALNVWLVCDPMRLRRSSASEEEFIEKATVMKSKMRTALADYANGFKPYVFKGVVAAVTPMLSPPVIEVNGFVDLLA